MKKDLIFETTDDGHILSDTLTSDACNKMHTSRREVKETRCIELSN